MSRKRINRRSRLKHLPKKKLYELERKKLRRFRYIAPRALSVGLGVLVCYGLGYWLVRDTPDPWLLAVMFIVFSGSAYWCLWYYPTDRLELPFLFALGPAMFTNTYIHAHYNTNNMNEVFAEQVGFWGSVGIGLGLLYGIKILRERRKNLG